MIDLPVMGMAHGIFNELHGHATSKAFAAGSKPSLRGTAVMPGLT
ncbi:hypothetical protein [Phaeobacter sp. B1627]|nr:hypothetical protein [Phaeobacter sp. B1627]